MGKEKTLKANHAYLAKCEEIQARQSSRALWISVGDANTKSFYASMASKKAYNGMRVLKDERGNLHEKHEDS